MSEGFTNTFSELFGTCPSSWRIVPFSQAIDFQEGPGILAKDFHDHGVPLLRLKSIQSTYATLDGCNFLDEEMVNRKWSHFRVNLGDMLVSTSATIGIVSEVTKQTVGSIPYTGIIRMRPNGQDVAPGFIKYFMQSSFFVQQAEAMASGSVLRHFGPTHLRLMFFPVPPLVTQRKIASILSAYDDLIENNTRRIAILEAMAQAIYREWFVEFRFPGHEKVKFVDSTLGRIPEECKVGVTNDVVRLLSGFAFKSKTFVEKGQYRLVTIKNVHDGQFIEDSDSLLDSTPDKMPAHCHLTSGDILMSLTGNIGRTCIVHGSGYLLNQRVAKLAPVNPLDRAYVYCLFRNPDTQVRLSNIANGVAQQNLSPVQTGNMPLCIAPRSLADMFSEVVTPIFWDIVQLYRKNSNLRTTRDLLLPKLISGQLDVEDLDIDIGETAAPTEEVAA